MIAQVDSQWTRTDSRGESAAVSTQKSEPNSAQNAVQKRFQFETSVTFPDFTTEPTSEWRTFFKEHRPRPDLVRRQILKMSNKKAHKHVIACLQAALINGQSQPWMYEVLAISMEIENYPKDDIERVVFSLSDFGSADYGAIIYSAAYLTRFDRKAAALKMYQQAARMLPERPEPYVMGIRLARDVGTVDDVQWAAVGTLKHCWTKDYAQVHQSALDRVEEQIRKLKAAGEMARIETLMKAVKAAQHRDLKIELTWIGNTDLDLIVEEPSGSICSFETPETPGGGFALNDGFGPSKDHCFETYLCPEGLSGPYRVRVKKVWGEPVGNRAQLKITSHVGTPDESVQTRTIVFDEDEVGLMVDLENGRRTTPRQGVSMQRTPNTIEQLAERAIRNQAPNRLTARRAQAQGDFIQSRGGGTGNRSGTGNNRRAGAFGYSPVIQTIPEGSSMTGQAVVSADRRYVRLAIQPVFSNITDVFTFSFLNGGQ